MKLKSLFSFLDYYNLKTKMEFVDRSRELKALEEEYSAPRSSLVILYGRRRVGKTRLLHEFLKDKPHLYYMADLESEILQRERLKRLAAEDLEDPLLGKISFPGWEELFTYLLEKIFARSNEKKFVLALDEFSYLLQVSPALPSVLQKLWDTRCLGRPIMLVLCGSLLGLMYRHTLSYRSPLYGRRTLDLKLVPLTFADYLEFFPHISKDEAFKFYALTNGTPWYVELLERRKDLWWNILERILEPFSPLYNEPRFILQEEIREATTYFSILEVIAQGEHKIGNIARRLGLKTSNLTSFLDRLQELDLVYREVPVTEKNPAKSKKGLYFIRDNFFRFWFRYVFPYRSYLETGRKEEVLSRIKADWEHFSAPVFERVCAESVWRLPLPFDILKIGRFWSKDIEIDVVALGEKEVLLGECKYQRSKVSLKVFHELQGKAKNFPQEGRKVYYAIFSRSGFKKDLLQEIQKRDDLFLWTIEDL